MMMNLGEAVTEEECLSLVEVNLIIIVRLIDGADLFLVFGRG